MHDDRNLRQAVSYCAERPHDILVVMALLEALSVEHPWTQREAEVWWRQRRAGAGQGAATAPAPHG